MQVFLCCAGHGFGAFGGVDAVGFDDGRVDADEDFGFVQVCYVAAGENGGGAFGVGDQGGDQAGSAAFHGGNGGVGCNELFDDGINGVWVHSENYLQS